MIKNGWILMLMMVLPLPAEASSWGKPSLSCQAGQVLWQEGGLFACQIPALKLERAEFLYPVASGSGTLTIQTGWDPFTNPRMPICHGEHQPAHCDRIPGNDCGNPRRFPGYRTIPLPSIPGRWKVIHHGKDYGTLVVDKDGLCLDVIPPEDS